MTVYPFPEYAPDLAQLDAGVTNNVSGVLPGANHYEPMPQFSAFSDALAGGKCLGAVAIEKSAGGTRLFAGTDVSIEEIDSSNNSWTDRTNTGGAYNLTVDEQWQFALYGTDLVAVTGAEPPQKIDINSGTAFSDLGGSPGQYRYVTVINEFLVLASKNGTPNEIKWSAIGDHEAYTAGTNLSGLQAFPDGGWIRAVTGGRTSGYVYQENYIRRMTFTGGVEVFRFDPIADDLGVLSPYSVVSVFGSDYFYSTRGFMRLNADETITPIGVNRVDKTFQTSLDPTRLATVQGIADPLQKRIWWVYQSADSTTGHPDKVIIYDFGVDRWVMADLDATYIASLLTLGLDMDTGMAAIWSNLDTDVPYSLDSQSLAGGAPVVATFDKTFKMAFASTTNQAAVIDTGEIQPNGSGRAFVQGITPVVDTTAATVSIGTKNLPGDAFTFGSDVATESSTGEAPFRASGRYFKARVKIPAGTSWTKAHGVLDPRFVSDGVR